MTHIAAVLFDADGVLQHPSHDWVEALDAVGGPGFAQAVFDHGAPALRGEASLRDCVERAAAAHATHVDVDDVLALWGQFAIDVDAVDLVAAVRRSGATAHLATNQQDVRRDVMRRRYAGVFDEEFYSCEMGVAKPDAAFFETALARLSLAPADVAFIDDSPGNVATAQACGIRARLHDPRTGAAGLGRVLRALGLDVL